MDVAAIIKYFDLNEHPFMTSPDPRFLYFSSQVKEALAKCEFMARDRIGPIYMYGPIGSGKTSLVRRLRSIVACSPPRERRDGHDAGRSGRWGRGNRAALGRGLIRDDGRVRGDAPADHHRATEDVRGGQAREAAPKGRRDQGERPASRSPDQTRQAQDGVSAGRRPLRSRGNAQWIARRPRGDGGGSSAATRRSHSSAPAVRLQASPQSRAYSAASSSPPRVM